MNTSLHSQINNNKLRTVGTFLVPIVPAIFYFGIFLFLLFCFGFSSTSEYYRLIEGYGVIGWGNLSFHTLRMLTSSVEVMGILAITFTIFYKMDKATPKGFGLVWSLGQGGWKKAFSLNLKIIVVLILFFTVILNLTHQFFGPVSINFVTDSLYEGRIKISNNVSGPFFEEVIFRGMYCTLFVRYGVKWRYTILITGIAFGLTHLLNDQSNIMKVSFATVVGWFLGWIFYKTRTLIVPIAWHYAINGFIDFAALRPDLLGKISGYLIV